VYEAMKQKLDELTPEDRDEAERWSWTKASVGSRIFVPGPHDSTKKLRAL
jgi:hypothetical protein